MGDTPLHPVQMPQSIAAGIVKVMSSVKRLAKDDNNKFANYRYASIDAFLEAIGPLCAEAGIFILAQEDQCEVVAGEKSDSLRIRWAFTLGASDGSLWGPVHRTVTVPAQGAQAYGSAQSYALKQFERGLFQVPTGDADDPDAQEAKPLPRSQPAKPKPETPEVRRMKLLNMLKAAPGGDNRAMVTDFCRAKGIIGPAEEMESFPINLIPDTLRKAQDMCAEIERWAAERSHEQSEEPMP